MSREQRGATLADSLIALAILCMTVPTIVHLSQGIRNAHQKTIELAKFDRAVLQAENMLRRELQRIRIPPELASVPTLKTAAGLRIYYLDGNPRGFLEIMIENGANPGSTRLVFVASNADTPLTLSFTGAALKLLAPSTEEPLVRLDIEGAGGTRAGLIAATGTWPLQ